MQFTLVAQFSYGYSKPNLYPTKLSFILSTCVQSTRISRLVRLAGSKSEVISKNIARLSMLLRAALAISRGTTAVLSLALARLLVPLHVSAHMKLTSSKFYSTDLQCCNSITGFCWNASV